MTEGPDLVRASALTPSPWPNGRGVTRDVVRHETASGGIDWLVSIADLEEDAAFSHFPGIDRVFTLVAGGPVDLTLGDDPPMRCHLLAPSCFPGDRPTTCTMRGIGPSRALNLFVDRGLRRARAVALTLAAGHEARTGGSTAAVHCASGSVRIGGTVLEPGDTLLRVGAREIRAVAGPASVVLAEIEDVATRA